MSSSPHVKPGTFAEQNVAIYLWASLGEIPEMPVQEAFIDVQFAAISAAMIWEEFIWTGIAIPGGANVGTPGMGVGSKNCAPGGGR